MTDAACIIDGCEKAHQARGWCEMHYVRWRRNGDPNVAARGPRSRPGSASPNWLGADIGYPAAHRRVRMSRGLASTHICGCGDQAAQWAYDHSDPNEKHGPHRSGGAELTYSVDPMHYLPMCVPCHKRFDLDHG